MTNSNPDASEKLSHSAMSYPVIILVEPQLGENIGTAARAMANFGLKELRLVAPRDGWPNEKAQKSSANAINVINDAKVFETFEEAIHDIHYLCATTARPRDMVKQIFSPETAAQSMHKHSAKGEKTAILFGPEKSGLTNTHISHADAIIIAPVDPTCASLNLAQAVLLLGYEWRRSCNEPYSKNHTNSSKSPPISLGRETQFDGPAREGTDLKQNRAATKAEMDDLFKHLQKELEFSGFLRTVEKTPQMMRNIRNMIIRMEPTDQDVRTLRGMIGSLVKGPNPPHS